MSSRELHTLQRAFPSAGGPWSAFTIRAKSYGDLAALKKLADRLAKHQVAYLTDMAKTEALDTMGENRKAVELLDQHV